MMCSNKHCAHQHICLCSFRLFSHFSSHSIRLWLWPFRLYNSSGHFMTECGEGGLEQTCPQSGVAENTAVLLSVPDRFTLRPRCRALIVLRPWCFFSPPRWVNTSETAPRPLWNPSRLAAPMKFLLDPAGSWSKRSRPVHPQSERRVSRRRLTGDWARRSHTFFPWVPNCHELPHEWKLKAQKLLKVFFSSSSYLLNSLRPDATCLFWSSHPFGASQVSAEPITVLSFRHAEHFLI